MKYTSECPKCFSKEIVEIQGSRYTASSMIYLNKWGTKYVMLDRYLCRRCGFIEEFARLDDQAKKKIEEVYQANSKNSDDGYV